jgi:hypothetical protein
LLPSPRTLKPWCLYVPTDPAQTSGKWDNHQFDHNNVILAYTLLIYIEYMLNSNYIS